MANSEERIRRIIEHKAADQAKRTAAKRSADEQEAALKKRRKETPARWAEHWQTFLNARNSLNEQLCDSGLRIEMRDNPRGRGPNEIAMFQVFLYDGDKKSQHFLTCTVNDVGDLFVSRHLPGLSDTKSMSHQTLGASTIESFLLRFVESAQGLRSMTQMMTDK